MISPTFLFGILPRHSNFLPVSMNSNSIADTIKLYFRKVLSCALQRNIIITIIIIHRLIHKAKIFVSQFNLSKMFHLLIFKLSMSSSLARAICQDLNPQRQVRTTVTGIQKNTKTGDGEQHQCARKRWRVCVCLFIVFLPSY